MSQPNQLPPAAVIITHEVADWATWKAEFDRHEGARAAAGFLGHHINRALDNPNRISIYLAASDLAKAKAFAAGGDRVVARPVRPSATRGAGAFPHLCGLRDEVPGEA